MRNNDNLLPLVIRDEVDSRYVRVLLISQGTKNIRVFMDVTVSQFSGGTDDVVVPSTSSFGRRQKTLPRNCNL